ncbi:MAG: RDD family protein [Bacteroidota bacterium]
MSGSTLSIVPASVPVDFRTVAPRRAVSRGHPLRSFPLARPVPMAVATSDPSLATRARSVLVRRAGAFSLDASVALFIALLVSMLVLVIPEVPRERFFGAGLLIGGLYLLFRDGLPLGFLRGRSIGKRLLWLLPIRLGGTVMSLGASAKRNWTVAMVFLFPGLANLVFGYRQIVLSGNIGANDALLAGFLALLAVEMLLVLVDPVARRIGDRMANTRVIEG